MPTALAPRRRRRFAERELLDRLGRYEDLLHQNNIDFEPLHAPVAATASANAGGKYDGSPEDAHPGARAAWPERPSREETTVKSEEVFEAK